MVVLPYLLPFLVGSVVVIREVEMALHCRHVLIGVVLVVVGVRLLQLLVLAVVLPDAGISMAVGIVLWGLVVASQA